MNSLGSCHVSKHELFSRIVVTIMSRNIESVASIFLDQIEEDGKKLENVSNAKESWGSKKDTPVEEPAQVSEDDLSILDYLSDVDDADNALKISESFRKPTDRKSAVNNSSAPSDVPTGSSEQKSAKVKIL